MNADLYRQRRDELVQLCNDAIEATSRAGEPAIPGRPDVRVAAIDRTLTDRLALISRKTREDEFEIVLVSGFGCGKSTTLNALAGGRTLCPTGNGMKTSGCIVRAQNLADPAATESAEVEWRNADELVKSLDTERFRCQAWRIAPERFDSDAIPESLAALHLENPDDLALIQKVAESEFACHAENGAGYDPQLDGHLDVARIALLISRFYGSEELSSLKIKQTAWSPNDIARIVTFPVDWEERWKDGCKAQFGLEEIAFLFVGSVRIRIHSATLAGLGCVVTDCPGLFASRWDEDVAIRAMTAADAILYLLNGWKTVELSDLKAMCEVQRYGMAHKLVFAQNMRTDKASSERIRHANASFLSQRGIPQAAEAIILYNARDASLGREAEHFLVERPPITPEADKQTRRLLNEFWRFALVRSAERAVPDDPTRPERLTPELVSEMIEESGLPQLERSLADVVLKWKARFTLIENGARVVEDVLEHTAQALNRAESDAEQKEEDARLERTAAQALLDDFETDCEDILGRLDDDGIDHKLAAEWGKLLLDRQGDICQESAEAIVSRSSSFVLTPSDYRALLDGLIKRVFAKHARGSLVGWAQGIRDGTDVTFNRAFREAIILYAQGRIREKWAKASKGVPLLDDIPMPTLTGIPSVDEATVPIVEQVTDLYGYVCRLPGLHVVSAVSDMLRKWIAQIPIFEPIDPVKSWRRKLAEPVERALKEIARLDKEDNAAVAYIRSIRNQYGQRFKDIIRKPRRDVERLCKDQDAHVSLRSEERKALADHATRIREDQIVPLRDRVVRFRCDCETEFPSAT